MNRQTLAAGGAGLALALSALAGCTPSGGGDGDTDRRSQNQACPDLGEDLDPDATFSWTYSVDTSSFDPDKIADANAMLYLYPIYDSLVHVDPQGEPQPMLAESWEISDDGNDLELTLIDAWTYHDGTPFDADSVVANIQRKKQDGSYNQRALSIVTDVEALDERTVRLSTEQAAGALVNILGGSAGMMMSPAVMDDDTQDVSPTGGSGAYELTEYVSGSRAEFTAVDGYWDPSVQNVDKLVFQISGDDNARLNALTTGATDASFLRPSQYEAGKNAGLTICQGDDLLVYSMNLNTSEAEFGRSEVRAAINHAIDREAVSTVTEGFCRPSGQLYPDWYFAAGDAGPESSEFDPERARELLAEAGLEDGFDFELQVVNLETYLQIAEIVQANLAEVGIDMTVTPVENAVLKTNFSVDKSAQAIFYGEKAQSDPSLQTAAYYLPDGFNNPGGWGTDEITALYDETLSGRTLEERSSAYDALMSAVDEEVAPNIVLCHASTPYAMNDRVRGFRIWADGTHQFRGIGMAAQ